MNLYGNRIGTDGAAKAKPNLFAPAMPPEQQLERKNYAVS